MKIYLDDITILSQKDLNKMRKLYSDLKKLLDDNLSFLERLGTSMPIVIYHNRCTFKNLKFDSEKDYDKAVKEVMDKDKQVITFFRDIKDMIKQIVKKW